MCLLCWHTNNYFLSLKSQKHCVLCELGLTKNNRYLNTYRDQVRKPLVLIGMRLAKEFMKRTYQVM